MRLKDPDLRELRRQRTERLFARMDELGIDACIFDREANARYATGVRGSGRR